MPSNTPWLRLADIADNSRNALRYVTGMTYEDFCSNSLVIDATERCILRISEAAIKLGPFAEDVLPSHDWKSIRGIGNILRHDYDRISRPIIWETISQRLQPLLTDIEATMAAHGKSEM